MRAHHSNCGVETTLGQHYLLFPYDLPIPGEKYLETGIVKPESNVPRPPELFLLASPQDATTLPLLLNLFHIPLPHSQLISPRVYQ